MKDKIEYLEKQIKDLRNNIYDSMDLRINYIFDKKTKDILDKLPLMTNEIMNDLFEQGLFMQKAESKVIKMITSEVRVAIKNSELHKLVGDLIKQYMQENLKPIINNIIEKNNIYFNEKLSKEYQVVKELSYSINAEIKHILINSPISYNSEQIIKDKIMNELNKISKQHIKIEYRQ